MSQAVPPLEEEQGCNKLFCAIAFDYLGYFQHLKSKAIAQQMTVTVFDFTKSQKIGSVFLVIAILSKLKIYAVEFF